MNFKEKAEVSVCKMPIKKMLLYLLFGVIIGLGAVLPGISGGVLGVIFGIYKPIMNFVSNPIKTLKKNAEILIPALIGIAIGFLLISRALGFLLDRYPNPSICFFVGLIGGMLPALFADAGKEGRGKSSYIAMAAAFAAIIVLLTVLKVVSVTLRAEFGGYLFCGFCIALSIIVPGMSFSTLLMPLGLYTPLIAGIGGINMGVLIPVGIGFVVSMLLLARLVSRVIDKYYSMSFHAIIGIVVAATLWIIPYGSFISGPVEFLTNLVCMAAGVFVSYGFGKINVKK